MTQSWCGILCPTWILMIWVSLWIRLCPSRSGVPYRASPGLTQGLPPAQLHYPLAGASMPLHLLTVFRMCSSRAFTGWPMSVPPCSTPSTPIPVQEPHIRDNIMCYPTVLCINAWLSCVLKHVWVLVTIWCIYNTHVLSILAIMITNMMTYFGTMIEWCLMCRLSVTKSL